MGACASSQHEHPPLHGPEVSKDEAGLKCKVPALQVTGSREDSLPGSGKAGPSTAAGTASLQASAETDGLAKASSPLGRQLSVGRASGDGRPGSAGRPPLPPSQRASPQYPLPGQAPSPPQANGAIRSQASAFGSAMPLDGRLGSIGEQAPLSESSSNESRPLFSGFASVASSMASSAEAESGGGAGHPTALKVAMSLPGDRDAQRMLLGEQPLSKGRPLRPLGSVASREGRSLPKRSESMPGSSHQKHLERKADPGIDHILGLALSVFRTDAVLLHLRDKDEVLAKFSNVAAFEPGTCAAVCRLLEPPPTEVFIVEDPSSDPRLQGKPDICEQVKFFVAKPLIASNGYHMGSLCLCNAKARKFDLSNKLIMGNMADLVVRELWGAYEHQHKQRVMQLIRVVGCYSEPLLFVEVSQTQPWMVLHLNEAAVTVTGLKRTAATNQKFWDVFTGIEESNAVKLENVMKPASCGFEFHLEGMQANTTGEAIACPLTLIFRPAVMEAMESAERSSEPAKQKPVTNAGRQYYFVCIKVDADTGVTSAAERSPFVGLQIGLLLGKGAYGRVYKGYYRGNVVAVKVCDSDKVRRNEHGKPLEADLTARLGHPNLVSTLDAASAYREPVAKLAWEVAREAEEAAHGVPAQQQSSTAPMEETWLLLEYCDQGSLMDAVTCGWFRAGPQNSGGPNLPVIATTISEIALGMEFLHSQGIVHGDLSSGNVLLTSSQANPHGFCAKISDFGLARNLDLVSRVETKTTGTVTHMPPEVLSDGIISKGADVYAFGVLLWELMNGKRAWDGLTPAQVMLAVALQKQTLSYLPHAHPELVRLGQRCIAHEADDRPTFREIHKVLSAIKVELKGGTVDDSAMVNYKQRAFSFPR